MLAGLIGRLRCHIEIWSQKQCGEHEYSGYGYAIPNPEEPSGWINIFFDEKWITTIRNLT
jgi:hypothetical protein